jgi:hypothetical protein
MATNAYFLGKHVLPVEKCTGFAWWGELMNRLIHRSWGENLGAIISLTHHTKHLWILLVLVCQWVSLRINRGKETFLALVGPYFLRGFFLGFGSEDLGTERTVLMAVCNRSNGVLRVGMVSIVSPLHGRSTMTPYNGFVFPLLPPQDVPKDQKKRFNGLFANLQTRYRDETLVDMVI